MSKIVFSLLSVIFVSSLLYAQDVEIEKKTRQKEEKKKQVEARRDSARVKAEKADRQQPGEGVEADSTEAIQVTSNLYWYDLENNLSTRSDRSGYEIFRLKDEKLLIYRDLSDIFRPEPLWFYFNLIENGRPAYISMINTLPHQTPFYFGAILMNDQVQGGFNTQFIPLNFVRSAETDLTKGIYQNHGLWGTSKVHLTPNSLHTEKPFTKIVYKQGSYGYADTDVYFEFPFSGNLAVQLGGMRKLSGGSYQDSEFDGDNYRGEVTWQYSPSLYLRGQIFLNRTEGGLTSLDYTQKIPFSYNKEARNDYSLDLTWLVDDTTNQRLHVLLFHSNYQRKFTDRYSAYTLETKSKRYGIDANYNISLGKSELLIGAGAIFPKVFGDPFKEIPFLTSYNTYAKLQLPINEIIHFHGGAQISYLKDYDIQIAPEAGLDLSLSENQQVSFSATHTNRLPTAVERFFDWDTLYGNQNLKPETHTTLYGYYLYKDPELWRLKLEAGYHRIENEIIWQDPVFNNGQGRDFLFTGFQTGVNLWKFEFSLSGQYTLADINYTSRSSLWGRIHFHESLLNGALIVDAIGTASLHDAHQDIMYHPRLDRFYYGTGQTDAYIVLNWKIALTIQTAYLFFEMDNSLSEDYEVIFGYYEFFRRYRFGLNWILWD